MGLRPFGAPPVAVLDRHEYVAEEFFLEGEAEAYRHVGDAWADGRWESVVLGLGAYRTRLLVVRPASGARFNGSVVLHWQNVSAGREGPAPVAGEVYDGGFAWVGVSAQEAGIFGFPAGFRLSGSTTQAVPLVGFDPTRYGSLRHPGDQGSFGIFADAARAVGPCRSAVVDVDPLGGLDVRRVIADGGSQSAMRLCAHLNGVHERHPVLDGCLLAVWEGRAPHLEQGPLGPGVRTGIRSDLTAPVLVVNSEYEVLPVRAVDRPEHDGFRLWEVAGSSHGTYEKVVQPRDGWLPNPLRWSPVHQAAVRAMHRWLAEGEAPASFPLVEVEAEPRLRIRRGDDGNAVGGLRLPEIAVPTWEHHGSDARGGKGPVFGAARRLPDGWLSARYGSPDAVLEERQAVAARLVAAGALRGEDVPAMEERWRADVAGPPWGER